jgi:hypothetical protein
MVVVNVKGSLKKDFSDVEIAESVLLASVSRRPQSKITRFLFLLK